LSTDPSTIEPGVASLFKANLANTGSEFVKNLRVELKLPDEIGFFNDVSKKKLSKLNSGDSGEIVFNIIALPGISEGIYQANLSVDYVNHIGEERNDEYKISLIVKSKPRMYVQIEESDVYREKNVGEITVKFVNNDVADFKFLTVELQESDRYTILSPKKVYVGDLDSDDFESVDYRIKVKGKDEILIPLKITYQDSMNNPISDDVSAVLTLYSGKDLGKVESNKVRNVIVVLVVIGGGWWFWKRWKRKKKREKY